MSRETTEAKTFDVVGIGLNATDIAIEVPEFPGFNSKTEFQSAEWQAGGQVATAMVACRRLGLTVSYIGRFGSDAMGVFQRESLEAEQIDLAHAKNVEDCPNQTAFIIIDQKTGERTILWRRDERLELRPEEIAAGMITCARVLHVDGHDALASARAGAIAREADIPVVADVDNIYPGLDELLGVTDYLICSESFPARHTNEPDIFDALEPIQENYGNKLVAATLGAEGVLARTGGKFLYHPAYEASCRDTTGAGDVFHGAFILGVLERWPVERTLSFSSAMAALSCEHLGARGGIRRREEVESRIAEGKIRAPRWPELSVAVVSEGRT